MTRLVYVVRFSRLSTPARPLLDESSAAHETVAQHVHFTRKITLRRPPLSARAPLYAEAPRCAHDATCSNVMRTGGLDAPFPFYLSPFMTFASIRAVMRLPKKRRVRPRARRSPRGARTRAFERRGGGAGEKVVFEVQQMKNDKL